MGEEKKPAIKKIRATGQMRKIMADYFYELDNAANDNHATIISTENSKIRALVLETNEEIVVARETAKVIREN